MKKIDGILLISIVVLTSFGLFMIYDASSVIAMRDFNDKYHYIKEQSVWAFLGFSAMIVFSYFDYRKLFYLALPLLITSLVLLCLVFIPGFGIKALGASRWIDFGFFVLQPAEFVKLSLAIYLSAWFSTKEKGRFLAFALLMGLVVFLIMAQPDMGTASIILFEALVAYFLSGGRISHFLISLPILSVLAYIFVKLEPYRAARLTAFLATDKSLEGTSYHMKQVLIALGSGGLMGVGVGNSLQKQAYLPENVTDSIFAIIGEEFGLLGALIVIGVLMVIIWRGFSIASQAKDQFGRLLAGCIIAFLGIQMVLNLASMTALFPLTGVPLPFISYGGSALIINLSAIGILLNISKHHHKTVST